VSWKIYEVQEVVPVLAPVHFLAIAFLLFDIGPQIKREIEAIFPMA